MRCSGGWRSIFPSLVLGILFLANGCDLPAQIEWSPDGATAAYRKGDQLAIFDAKGHIFSSVSNQKNGGGMAWTPDSKSLYVAADANDEAGFVTMGSTAPLAQSMLAAPLAINRAWCAGSACADSACADSAPTTAQSTTHPATHPATQPATGPATQPSQDSVILEYTSNHSWQSLARLPGQRVIYLRVSADGRWLLIASFAANETKATAAHLIVISLPTKQGYAISDRAIGACFLGHDMLAYAEKSADGDAGRIDEIKLDVSAVTAKRRELLNIVPTRFGWMQSCDGDILFTAKPLATPQPVEQSAKQCSLFRYTRANRGMMSIAENVGPLFAVSPDGKKVLFEKLSDVDSATQTSATQPTSAPALRRELSVMNANGSNPQILCTLTDSEDAPLAMWPAWHGSDRISFVGPNPKPIQQNGKAMKQYSVVDFALSDQGGLTDPHSLSDAWDQNLLPTAP
ncbi:MAG: hypothetical protein JO353_02140 [Phycisphaerae bacterium]|nr:hypothetical protein [Phycisphaerae bacterium]